MPRRSIHLPVDSHTAQDSQMTSRGMTYCAGFTSGSSITSAPIRSLLLPSINDENGLSTVKLLTFRRLAYANAMKNLIPSATENLFSEAKQRLGLTSDYALAKRMGWPQSMVTNYKKGKSRMGVRNAYDFAVKTGIPLEDVARAIIEDEAVTKGNFQGQTRPKISDSSALSR